MAGPWSLDAAELGFKARSSDPDSKFLAHVSPVSSSLSSMGMKTMDEPATPERAGSFGSHLVEM